MADRTTNALLLAIAIGLWVNVVSEWVRPVPVQAQSVDLSTIESYLGAIWGGFCPNSKIC